MSDYKYKIDKDALTQLLLSDTEPTKKQLQELTKVFNVVMIKHYSRYFYDRDELYQFAVLAILDRRKNYDPSFSAYTYIFTMFRNEIGNRVRKLTKETFVEDILPLSNASTPVSEVVELPIEVRKFRRHLTGELDFSLVELSKKEAIHLCCFINIHNPPSRGSVPKYIESSSNSLKVLYKLLLNV